MPDIGIRRRVSMINLPGKIRSMIADEDYKTDNIGMSEASILIFENKVLKVQEFNEEAENEYNMLQYLQDKLPVPKIYAHEASDGKSYLLMDKCPGQMACADYYLKNPDILCKLLANGLKSLWSVDISDCQSDWRLPRKLDLAAYYVKNNLVDLRNTEPDTFSENGFRNPQTLLQWLRENKPEEEPTLSHGDFCLPNVFGAADKICGYIDLGKCGIADKWCDIALCYRSLLHNYSDYTKNPKYQSSDVYSGDGALPLFRELGIQPDWTKIRYYILLDELF